MKIIGTLDSRDDADLLPEVLDQCKDWFDAIYAYDDGSQDGTYNILNSHSAVTKVWRAQDFSDEDKKKYLQHRRGYPLEMVKKDYPYQTEDIWVVRLEGDRFFLNQTPHEIVDRAVHAGHDQRCGVMLDFRRHREQGWGEVDKWPNWNPSLRTLSTWCGIDDSHNAVAFKVSDFVDYALLNRPRPWPGGLKNGDCNRSLYTKDMAYFEHQGRRSPKYWHWVYNSGSRPKSQKFSVEWDFTSPETVYETVKSIHQPYKLLPWISFEKSIDKLLEVANAPNWKTRPNIRYFCWGLEYALQQGWVFEREDL